MPTIEEHFVDEIYEAAVVPDKWPVVLERLAAMSGSRAGGIIAVDARQRMRAVATEVYRPIYESFPRDGSARYDNVRARRAATRRHPGFLRDTDLCTVEELESDLLYREFLRPNGLGWTVGTLVNVPTSDMVIFDFARRTGEGPYDSDHVAILDGYRPHLARAAFLSLRMGLERARSMTDAMSMLGVPATVLDPHGTSIVANDAFERIRSRVDPVLRGRTFGDGLVDVLYVPRSSRKAAGDPIRSFPIAGTDEEPALVVHVLPVRRSALDVFSGAASIVVVTPVVGPTVPPIDIVSGLFDLSPAEARVARAMAEGLTVEDCARDFGVSLETVRRQVKNAMGKTGTHRQVDLVRLILGAGGGPRPV